MNPPGRLTLGLAAAGVAAALGAWASSRLGHWRRKNPYELERRRRLDLQRRGRITAGQVVELVESTPKQSPSRLIVYKYEVAGVTYEAAQEVSMLAGLPGSMETLAGQTASIKYDPKNPANSIIACEEWSGLPE